MLLNLGTFRDLIILTIPTYSALHAIKLVTVVDLLF
jgi:hypothetical protein